MVEGNGVGSRGESESSPVAGVDRKWFCCAYTLLLLRAPFTPVRSILRAGRHGFGGCGKINRQIRTEGSARRENSAVHSAQLRIQTYPRDDKRDVCY